MKRKIFFILFIAASFLSRAQSACANMNFESSAPGSYAGVSNSVAITGWTISSQNVYQCYQTPTFVPGAAEVSLVSTPMFSVPIIGTIPQSPLGGSVVACLNYSVYNYSAT